MKIFEECKGEKVYICGPCSQIAIVESPVELKAEVVTVKVRPCNECGQEIYNAVTFVVPGKKRG